LKGHKIADEEPNEPEKTWQLMIIADDDTLDNMIYEEDLFPSNVL